MRSAFVSNLRLPKHQTPQTKAVQEPRQSRWDTIFDCFVLRVLPIRGHVTRFLQFSLSLFGFLTSYQRHTLFLLLLIEFLFSGTSRKLVQCDFFISCRDVMTVGAFRPWQYTCFLHVTGTFALSLSVAGETFVLSNHLKRERLTKEWRKPAKNAKRTVTEGGHACVPTPSSQRPRDPAYFSTMEFLIYFTYERKAFYITNELRKIQPAIPHATRLGWFQARVPTFRPCVHHPPTRLLLTQSDVQHALCYILIYVHPKPPFNTFTFSLKLWQTWLRPRFTTRYYLWPTIKGNSTPKKTKAK